MNNAQFLKHKYDAGSQTWFPVQKKYSQDYRIHHCGCGVIAMMDFCVYKGIIPQPQNRQEYMCAVKKMERNWLHVIPKFGISPYFYSFLCNMYCRFHHISYRIHGMPIVGKKETCEKKLEKLIQEQLEKDLPLIFAAGPLLPIIGRKKSIQLYCLDGERMKPSGHTVKGHYMTITGIRWIQKRECYICLASWGKFYYMKLSDYIEYRKYTIPMTNLVYRVGVCKRKELL